MVLFERIENYNRKEISNFILKAFKQYDIYTKIQNHSIILIKPNLLSISDKQEAVTSHPLIAEIIIDILSPFYKGKIIIADGAAASYLDMKKVFKETGYYEIANQNNIELRNFNTDKYMEINGIKLTSLLKKKPFIFNIAKLKTHMLTTMTLSVKNLYGLIPSKYKILYHSQHSNPKSFSEFTVKVFKAVCPHFNIVDGIVGMDGNGPSNGRIVNPGIIAASDNGFALDHFLCDFTDIPIEKVRYLKYAIEKEYYLGSYKIEKDYDKFPYELPSSNKFELIKKVADNKIVKKLVISYPHIRNNTCRKCMNCYNICPENAIIIKDEFPFVRQRKCIACFCCIEVCPYDSIPLKQGLLERIFNV